MAMLDGPRLPPARPGKPDALVVLLHGYGSNGDDLIGLAPYWREALPRAQFIAPNAPERAPGAPAGYQWFARPVDPDPAARERNADIAARTLHGFLDAELARYALAPSRLALVGFSQGTMMALHAGLRRAPGAAILGFSGMLVAPGRLKTDVKAAPPILLVHGDQDPVIPISAMFDAADALGEAGFGAQWHVSHGAPHTIARDGLDLGGAFLRWALSRAA